MIHRTERKVGNQAWGMSGRDLGNRNQHWNCAPWCPWWCPPPAVKEHHRQRARGTTQPSMTPSPDPAAWSLVLLPWIMSNESWIFWYSPLRFRFPACKNGERQLHCLSGFYSNSYPGSAVQVWRRPLWIKRKLQSLLSFLERKVTYLSNQLYQIFSNWNNHFSFQEWPQVQTGWAGEASPCYQSQWFSNLGR